MSCSWSNSVIYILKLVAEKSATTFGDLPDCWPWYTIREGRAFALLHPWCLKPFMELCSANYPSDNSVKNLMQMLMTQGERKYYYKRISPRTFKEKDIQEIILCIFHVMLPNFETISWFFQAIPPISNMFSPCDWTYWYWYTDLIIFLF